MENKPLDQVRKLTKALIISGFFNIILITLMFYWWVKESASIHYLEQPSYREEISSPLAIDPSNDEVIRQFKNLTRDQLVAMLNNTQLVENGYAQRDLALAVLVSFHHFDLTRALAGTIQPTQHRAIVYGQHKGGNPAKVVAYPGLTEQQFEAILKFANTEKWPLTPRGLYMLLKTQPEDPTIADAFMLTPEFLTVEQLFNRSDIYIDKIDLLKMILEGSWSTLSTFVHQQKETGDLSMTRRQAFLLNYIDQGSKSAAVIILKTDGLFALKRLDDSFVRKILTLLVEKNPVSEQFALALLTSPRGDEVWQLAAHRLYEYAGEPKPERFHHHAALMRFLPEAQVLQKPVAVKPTKEVAIKPISAKRERTYVVQEGDSLWKIARKYKVDVELIKEKNGLKSDALKPGTTLKLP